MAAAAAGKAQHPCSICEEPMEVHRGGSACAHAFCRACLTGHVRARVEPGGGGGGAGTVRCLDASCDGTLDPELCRAALPDDVFERWCAALLLELAAEKKWRRCPKCDFFVEKVDGCLHIICRCEYQFCYGCGVEWGKSCSCDQEEEDDSESEDE